MSADEKTRYEAEMREKAIMDERSALTNSERRGFKKGIEEGKIRGKAKIVDNCKKSSKTYNNSPENVQKKFATKCTSQRVIDFL